MQSNVVMKSTEALFGEEEVRAFKKDTLLRPD
jgi:hypothetical protein